MSDYSTFLESKRRQFAPLGPQVDASDVHPLLHEWQADIVKWAVTRGRAAIFADCGLGKTFMQLEWARIIAPRTLIVAPLSVARQTVNEAHHIDLTVTYVRSDQDVTNDGIWITNYEMIDHFALGNCDAVVLDESSILKNVDSTTRRRLTSTMADVPYRLACTATPAPNDVSELTNHAEFLGVSTRQDMLGAYFTTNMDNKSEGGGYRVKGHAKHPMFSWMAQWAVAIRKPSDLGYSDDAYELPPLNVVPEIVDVEIVPEDQLFATELGGVGGRATIRRATLEARVARAAELVESTDDQWPA